MFEPGKIYKTRGGEDALIYCVDAPGEYPVHGRVGGYSKSWTLEGMILGLYHTECDYDLLPGAIDEPPESACVIVDLMAQVRAAKIRAERAEAAIERAREAIEKELRNSVPGENVIWFHACASHIAAIMGLTIAPARELTVTWNKEIEE